MKKVKSNTSLNDTGLSPTLIFVQMEIPSIINKLVMGIREELSVKYDVETPTSDNYKYRDLCDTACILLRDRVKSIPGYGELFTFKTIHGEQRHTSRIKSADWIYEHTWAALVFNCSDLPEGSKFYIDPTASQFGDMYLEPTLAWFAGWNAPEWYLPDRDNPYWMWSGWLSDKFNISRARHWTFSIIRFFEYDVLGWISDIFHEVR